MKTHTKVCTRNSDGTWKYTCTCGKVSKDKLKFEASVAAIHTAHLKSEERYVNSH
jgi:hypothetical protein